MSTVDIHLVIHREGENINVDFVFDKNSDSIDQVVEELTESCHLSEREQQQMQEEIMQQIMATQKTTITSSNSEEPQVISPTLEPMYDDLSDSDDEYMNDPEYMALLKAQEKERKALEEKHRNEQFDFTANAPQPSTTEDLIMFS